MNESSHLRYVNAQKTIAYQLSKRYISPSRASKAVGSAILEYRLKTTILIGNREDSSLYCALQSEQIESA